MKKSTWKERFSKFILAVLVVGIIFSCSNIEQVQAASKKGTYYYGTVLNRTKGGKKYGSWQPGTKKVKYTSKSNSVECTRSNTSPRLLPWDCTLF